MSVRAKNCSNGVKLTPTFNVHTKQRLLCVVRAGPTEESNWVMYGRLLVGAYPASVHDEANTRILSGILRLGITTFVCLQQECVAHLGRRQYVRLTVAGLCLQVPTRGREGV
jgi:hypothetical protein